MASTDYIAGLRPSKSLEHADALVVRDKLEKLKLKRHTGDESALARELTELADAVRTTDFELAIVALTNALAIGEQKQDPALIVDALAKRSWARYWRGDLRAAFQDAIRAEETARAGVTSEELYRALFMSAKTHACLGRFERAATLWREAIGMTREIKSVVREADCVFEHAFVQSAQGEFDKSLDNRLHAHMLMATLGDESGLRYSYANVAEGYADLGLHAIALDWAGQTILSGRDITPEERACQLHVKGRCLVDLLRVAEARATLESALAMTSLPAAKKPAIAALVHAELARVAYLEDDATESLAHYEQTLAHVQHWSDAMVCIAVIQNLGRLKTLRPSVSADASMSAIATRFEDALTAIRATTIE